VRRPVRIAATLVVLALAFAYILRKVDLGKTTQVIAHAKAAWISLAACMILTNIVPLAWRWRLLLRARGVEENLLWLTRAYLVSYAAGQVLPTSVGGDASRIYETARRHPGAAFPITGSVFVERALGAAVTVVLAALGFLLAIGRYPVGAYLWIELVFVAGTLAVGIVFFSRAARTTLTFALPVTRKLRVERFARLLYDAVHGYRAHPRTLALVALTTLLVQLMSIGSIFATGRAVGIRVSPLAYLVLGPLLFLVMLLPFTINGLAVREAFFVSFLGNLHVPADAAFACGFLFFLTTLVLAMAGLLIILWESIPLVSATARRKSTASATITAKPSRRAQSRL
jgi:glycosyltransferase 2 family protein